MMQTPASVVHRSLAIVLTLTLAGAAPAAAPQGELQRAIELVEEGDFEGAVPALSSALSSMEGQPGMETLRAQAQLYMGVAYLELDQEVTARARFREALRLDPGLLLQPDAFSPQVLRVFEAARLEARAPMDGAAGAARESAAPAPVAPSRGTAAAAEAENRKGRRALPFVVLAGGGTGWHRGARGRSG